VLSVGEVYQLQEPHQLDSAKMRKAIVDYGIGSVLNVGGHAYNRSHWNEIIGAIQTMAASETRLGIPILYGIDAIHGANYTLDATLFPQPLAQAATFNPELVRQGASATAYETRASGIPWNFSPVLDVARQPEWSRVFETYGEDVYVCKMMGRAAIEGYQGSDPAHPEKVAACMKHFLGYSMPFTGKDRTTVYLHERQLRELFLPSFEEAIDAGALSVMINSGDLNGMPVHADNKILTELLRTELGFDGVAVTDWEDIMKLEYPHKVAKDLKEAVKMAINAGIDMSMVPNDFAFSDLLVELVEEEEVPMERINEAVYRILLMKERLGLFDAPHTSKDLDYPHFGSDSFAQLSYQAAAEGITLLKNEHILPLNPTTAVLVTGPMSQSLTRINGAWSRTWQGTDSKWNDSSKLTLAQAISTRFPNNNQVVGCELDSITAMQEAMQGAKKSEVIIACMGEGPSTEKVGDLDEMDLAQAQIDYVRELSKSGKKIVLVLVQNRPRIVREIEPYCAAIIMAYQPSDNGTMALADILSGAVNPSGKLPLTYPKFSNTLLTYDHKHTDLLARDFSYEAFDPQWEFGHGLSYSSFSYENIKLEQDTLSILDTLKFTVSVTNTSELDGKETVLVYVRDEVASIAPSVKRLRGFEKRLIQAQSSEDYHFKIPIQDLAFVNREQNWEVEKGQFTLFVADKQIPFVVN
jgi:beta-glucosidase